MFCIKCGVELADTVDRCPLCQTRVYHPELLQKKTQPLYPKDSFPAKTGQDRAMPILLTALSFATLLVVLLCDLQIHRAVTWSGYVIGALLTGYVALVLPGWFRKPNPVIFVPCSFTAAVVYLLYIDLYTGGSWFLRFAFPVAGGIGIIVTTLVTLLHYVRKGVLYTVGGSIMALGAFMLLMEYLLNLTFPVTHFVGWSLYPLLALMLLGGFLIFLAMCRPAREAMGRKFFF